MPMYSLYTTIQETKRELDHLYRLRDIYNENGYYAVKINKRIEILETQIDYAIKEIL